MRVIKTLVIGLGSSGTQICDAVAKRIEWELQDLNRVPWVKFLCIETNRNQESLLNRTNDFRVIKIDAEEFQAILQNPQHYDESIHLSQWADMETLRNLPGNEVTAGAGNIRMIGRLAFLYNSNYNSIKHAITERLRTLRELTGNQALEARGILADGTNPEIEFAAGNEVRVFVVGTLCGGTCSGLVSDFGFFLKTICLESEKVTGIFTLPKHDLAPAIVPAASRFKRNAYSALLELNHYHLTNRGNEPEIRFPDGVIPDASSSPYDLPYLMVPRQPGFEYETELNRAAADRIFLNIFAPETDPFAAAVDAVIFDREHRAHVFCSSGLSTVEFPAQQVIEACKKRLLSYALREWNNRPLEQNEEERRLERIGLTWDSLKDSLMDMQEGGSSLKVYLDQQKDEIHRLARSNLVACQESLDKLRAAFHQHSAVQKGGLYPGIVPQVFRENIEASATSVIKKLKNLVDEKILRFHDGPAPLQQLLVRAEERIHDLNGVQPPTYSDQVNNVNQLISDLGLYHRSPLLRLALLRGVAIDRLLPRLRKALNDEIESRLNSETQRSLNDRQVNPGHSEDGVLTRIRRRLRPVKRRLDSLINRVTRLSAGLGAEADDLARNGPLLNGVCIFEPETANGGTVRNEYQRCLVEAASDPAILWDRQRDIESERIIRTWEDLPQAVMAIDTQREDDWLLQDFNPNNLEARAIPEAALVKLAREASRPFLTLKSVNVLSRLYNIAADDLNPQLLAQDAAKAASPFLRVLPALAEVGGRSPVHVRRIVLLPESPYRQRFMRDIQPDFVGEISTVDSPDPFRCIMLEEWYRFPLSGVSAVLGTQGLHTAECNDFPNFHTRKDVFWEGISDHEIEKIRKAEEIIVVGVLLELVEPRGGALVLTAQAGGFGVPNDKRLPLSIRGASRYLAFSNSDIDGRALQGSLDLLIHRIGQLSANSHDFVQNLHNRLSEGGSHGIPDWDRQHVALLLTRYCARDDELYQAYVRTFPPDTAIIQRLRVNAGDSKPGGGSYNEPGLYCYICGGIVGKDEQDAARNGWRCYINPDHYFGADGHGH